MNTDKDKMSDPHLPIDKTDSPEDTAPFERWLDRKLKTAYGSVLEEPIPQDLIDLLRKKLD